ncbi:hypothetical protein [Metabacillus idriensis]|nr:hypothetical protein [Metabacillus idriensis]
MAMYKIAVDMEEEYLRTTRTLRDEGQIENSERMFFGNFAS